MKTPSRRWKDIWGGVEEHESIMIPGALFYRFTLWADDRRVHQTVSGDLLAQAPHMHRFIFDELVKKLERSEPRRARWT